MGVEQCGSGFGNYMIVLLLIVTRLLRGDTSTLHNDYEYIRSYYIQKDTCVILHSTLLRVYDLHIDRHQIQII